MPTTIKKVTLWRGEIENVAGKLASVLRPLAAAGADLKVTMAYRHTDHSKAAVEVFPIAGKRMMDAARKAGLAPSDIPTLHVEGDDKAALGASIGESLAAEGVNVIFLVTQVIGRKYASVVGFENEADLKAAASILRRTGKPRR